MSGRCDGSNALASLSETVCVKQISDVLDCKGGKMWVHSLLLQE